MRASPRTRALIAGGVFLGALAVRVAHVWQIAGAPFFDLYMGDAADFHVWAQRIAGGDWVGDQVFYHAPLYPYFLGAVYAVLGSQPLLVRLLQAVIGAAACAVLADAATRLASRRAGILAGAMLAVYAPAIFFAGTIQDSALDALLASSFLWILVGRVEAEDGGRLSWALAGAVLAALVLTRENALVLAAPVLLWIGLRRGLPWAGRRSAAAAFVGGLSLLLLPVAARNYAVGGEFHLTTFNLGANLYIGNNPNADGYYRPLRSGRGNPAFELQDAVELAELSAGRELTPREVSRYWAGRALDYVTSRPLEWLALLGRKAFLVWNASETADTEDQYTHAEWSMPLRISGWLFHFGVLAPLAALGVLATWDDRRRLWLFYALPAIYLASVVMFFVFARYRFPVVPFLTLLAAVGLDRLPGRVASAGRLRLAAAGLAVAALAVAANRPVESARVLQAHTRANMGSELQNRGRTQDALELYREALELDPRSSQAHFYLATLLHREGSLERALAHYEAAARLEPSNARIRNNFGSALASVGRLDAALAELRRAVELEPAYADAGANLGLVLAMRGDGDRAIEVFRQVLETRPDHVAARARLASTLLERGEAEEAYEHYARAFAAGGGEAVLRAMYHDAWERATEAGRSAEERRQALELARRAAALEPGGRPGPDGLRTLAAAHAAGGRYGEAAELAREALRLVGDSDPLAAELRRELALYERGASLRVPSR